MLRHFLYSVGAICSDRRGNIAVIFALALLPLLGVAGVAIDYSAIGMFKSRLQAAADTAALHAGKELRLAQMGKASAVTTAAQNYATSALVDTSHRLSNISVNSSLSNGNTSIQVSITATYQPMALRSFGVQSVPLSAQATAHPSVILCARSRSTRRRRSQSMRERKPRSPRSFAACMRIRRIRKPSTRRARRI